jgi:hypothetical protein
MFCGGIWWEWWNVVRMVDIKVHRLQSALLQKQLNLLLFDMLSWDLWMENVQVLAKTYLTHHRAMLLNIHDSHLLSWCRYSQSQYSQTTQKKPIPSSLNSSNLFFTSPTYQFSTILESPNAPETHHFPSFPTSPLQLFATFLQTKPDIYMLYQCFLCCFNNHLILTSNYVQVIATHIVQWR